jgi:hypothetical protein
MAFDKSSVIFGMQFGAFGNAVTLLREAVSDLCMIDELAGIRPKMQALYGVLNDRSDELGLLITAHLGLSNAEKANDDDAEGEA